jgi:predicted aspartyl protease
MRRDPALALPLALLMFSLAGGPALLGSLAAPLVALEPPGSMLQLERSRSGLPVVRAASGGVELRFAIDTGTSASLVSAAAADRLGLVPRARFPLTSACGSTQTALCGALRSLRIAGIDLDLDCLGWVPGERRLAGAEDVDGLLGADALARFDLWLDTKRMRARVAPPGSLLAWTDGQRLPLGAIGRRPAIVLDLRGLGHEGRAIPMVLDSGAEGTVLFGELARHAQSVFAGATDYSGRLHTATARLDSVPVVPLGILRAGGVYLEGGAAGLLPHVTDRVEAGLLPLSLLGPVLLDVAGGVVVARARLRARPRPPEVPWRR